MPKKAQGKFKRAAPARGAPKEPRRLDTRNGETLLTPALQQRMVQLLQAGNYFEVAARACGIHKSTAYDWLTRGARGEEPFKSLSDAVDRAQAESEAADVARMAQHGQQNWQALAWRLERKNNKRWGRRDALEITGDEDRPVAISGRVDLKRLSTDELRTLKALRAKARVDEDEPEPE